MEYGGDIYGFPEEVIELMLDKQDKQGNDIDSSIFEHDKYATATEGGFNWTDTIEGMGFWNSVLENKDFNLFFKRYPKQKFNIWF